MNLRDLKYLVTVADTLHFAKAAELCHISQPTLSMQLKKLEEELGIQFFERTNKKVLINDKARPVIEQARMILTATKHLQDLVKSASDPFAGSLSVGCIPTIAPYLLPHVIPVLKQEFPKLELQLREEKTDSLIQALLSGKLDVGIMALPLNVNGLEGVELYTEPFLLAVPNQHRLAHKKWADIEDLAQENLLLLEDGHCLRDQALAACHLSRHSTHAEFSATSLETLRQMVALGNGVTLLPALACAVQSTTQSMITTRPFKDESPARVVGMVWRTQSFRQSCFHKLAECFQNLKLPL